MRVSCVYATASRWGGPPVASEVRGDAAISTTPDAAPGLAARRRRILFVAEAVTLAHVVRPFALAQSLDPSRYEVHFACDPRYNQLLGPLPFRHHAIHTIPSERFFGNLTQGRFYAMRTLRKYVEADLRVLDEIAPDLVVAVTFAFHCRSAPDWPAFLTSRSRMPTGVRTRSGVFRCPT